MVDGDEKNKRIIADLKREVEELRCRCKRYYSLTTRLEEKLERSEEKLQKVLERIVKDHPELDLYLCVVMNDMIEEDEE